MEGKETQVWEALKGIMHGFPGNKRDDYYTQLVTVLLQKYHHLGYHMFLNIHFLHLNLDFFPPNCEAVRDELEERFHPDILEKWSEQIVQIVQCHLCFYNNFKKLKPVQKPEGVLLNIYQSFLITAFSTKQIKFCCNFIKDFFFLIDRFPPFNINFCFFDS